MPVSWIARLKVLLGGKAHPSEQAALAAPPAEAEIATVERARALLHQANLDGARALLEPYADRSHRLDTLVLLCRTRISQGDVDAAMSLLRRARVLYPASEELLETAAVAHAMKSEAVEALACWQGLVFATPNPSARVCVEWVRTYVQAAMQRPPRPGDAVSLVSARMARATDARPEDKLQFAESLYAIKSHSSQAVAMLQAALPLAEGDRDTSATWVGLDAWCQRTGRAVHALSPDLAQGKAVLLGELRDALVLPAFQWIPVLDEGRVALDRFVMHRIKTRRELPESPILLSNWVKLELRLRCQPTRVIDRRALLVGGMPQFYHQTVEFLGALAVAESIGVGCDLPLVVNADLAPFQLEQFALLGYGEDRLIRVAADEQVLFRDLLVPSRLVLAGRWMHPLIAQWHRSRFPASAADPRGRRLYLSRRRVERRRVTNEAALIERLATEGYETVYPEELSIAQQVALFRGVTHLVCPAGAALANMLYMAPGASIIVPATAYALQSPGDTYFDALAAACGHRFAWLPCRPVQFVGDRLIDSDFEVDILELQAVMHRLARPEERSG